MDGQRDDGAYGGQGGGHQEGCVVGGEVWGGPAGRGFRAANRDDDRGEHGDADRAAELADDVEHRRGAAGGLG